MCSILAKTFEYLLSILRFRFSAILWPWGVHFPGSIKPALLNKSLMFCLSLGLFIRNFVHHAMVNLINSAQSSVPIKLSKWGYRRSPFNLLIITDSSFFCSISGIEGDGGVGFSGAGGDGGGAVGGGSLRFGHFVLSYLRHFRIHLKR